MDQSRMNHRRLSEERIVDLFNKFELEPGESLTRTITNELVVSAIPEDDALEVPVITWSLDTEN